MQKNVMNTRGEFRSSPSKVGYGIEGRVAIVTGGARGIGKEICLEFSTQGAGVVVSDVDFDGATQVAQEIIERGGKAIPLKINVTSEAQIKEVIGRTIQTFGRLDILVNNAGINKLSSIEEISESEWDTIMAVNLKGVFFCSREASKAMKGRGWGRIVNMGSVAGKTGGSTSGIHYCTSKAGVMYLTRNFAYHLAPYGITVNAIAPGTIETNMTDNWTPVVKAELIKKTPVARLGKVSDIAAGAIFLASEQAEYITGEVLNINGGYLMD